MRRGPLEVDARGLRIAWWEALPEVVLGTGLLVFLLAEPDAASSALGSSTAVALMAGTGATWLIARVLAARLVPVAGLRVASFSLAAAGVLAVVVLPAYDDTTVVESFPTERVDARRDVTEATLPASTPQPPADAEPEPIGRGALRGIDHRAEGGVVAYRRADGSQVIGLEEIDVQPGPDYDVYLVAGRDREDIDGGVRLDDLRGNKGTQFYDVPAGVSVDPGAWSVLIWCQIFDVPIASATID